MRRDWHLRGVKPPAEPNNWDDFYAMINQYSPCEQCPGIGGLFDKLTVEIGDRIPCS